MLATKGTVSILTVCGEGELRKKFCLVITVAYSSHTLSFLRAVNSEAVLRLFLLSF
jgi:hypothetical protein